MEEKWLEKEHLSKEGAQKTKYEEDWLEDE